MPSSASVPPSRPRGPGPTLGVRPRRVRTGTRTATAPRLALAPPPPPSNTRRWRPGQAARYRAVASGRARRGPGIPELRPCAGRRGRPLRRFTWRVSCLEPVRRSCGGRGAGGLRGPRRVLLAGGAGWSSGDLPAGAGLPAGARWHWPPRLFCDSKVVDLFRTDCREAGAESGVAPAPAAGAAGRGDEAATAKGKA